MNSLILFITVQVFEFRRSRFDSLSTCRKTINAFLCLSSEQKFKKGDDRLRINSSSGI